MFKIGYLTACEGDGTGFRMLVCPGTGIDTDLFVRGTPLNVKFDAGCEAVRREVM